MFMFVYLDKLGHVSREKLSSYPLLQLSRATVIPGKQWENPRERSLCSALSLMMS